MDKPKPKSSIIYGFHPVKEAILSGREIERVFFKRGLQGEKFNEVFGMIRQSGIPFQMVPIEKLNTLTRKTNQGIVAFLSEIIYRNIEELIPSLFEQGKVPFLLVCDGIKDVRNFGALARTAECAGVDAVVVPFYGSAQINADAVKTSSGALHRISVCRTNNLTHTIKYLKECGIRIIAATEKAENLMYDTDLTLPLAIILGSESGGISAENLKIADEWLRIPLFGEIGSLNVSVAGAVVMYEVVRQRKKWSIGQ
jgi:23S rRNA (guanosine2251-2'-O)-methyltransferase